MPAEVFFVVVMMMGFPLALILLQRYRVAGKTLCYFLCENSDLVPMLLKPIDGDFVRFRDKRYILQAEKRRIIQYPTGWPKFFQLSMPSMLYREGRGEAIDWIEIDRFGVSSLELEAVLDPHWMAAIIRGAREGGEGPQTRLEKLFPKLALVFMGLILLFCLIIFQKLGGI